MITKEFISYLFFGVLTTAISYISFALACICLGDAFYLLANIISFVCAATFAYITNKLFVFHKMDFSPAVLAREMISFYSARLASFGMEEFGLYVFVSLLGWGEKSFFGISGTMVAKVILSFGVVMVNYAISKWIVFRKR